MSGLRIVADRNMRGVEDDFRDVGTVQLVDGRSLVAEDLRDADVLLVRSVTKVDETLLRHSHVRFVGTATSGFDHVDRAWLAQHDIGFSHAPGSNANSVVEYVLAAIAQTGSVLERLLSGGRMGIIGYGNIGRALAARCQALGIDYGVYDPWLPRDRLNRPMLLPEILSSDVVSVHAELTREVPWPSWHLLSDEALAAMGSDTLLINASRGEVVDTTALLSLLEQGGGPVTVLDVWEEEPRIAADLLRRVSLGSAHIAGYSLDGKFLATRQLRDAVTAHFDLPAVAGQSSLAPASSLQVPAGLTGSALLRWALASRYTISEDDRLLRAATLDVSAADAATAFDQLRKNYGLRRELAGSQLRIHAGNPDQSALLQALGCDVSEREAHQ
ncbi:MAG: 4-phosphoerythronate dehydrogenase [Halioglobus sp.]